MHSFLNEKIQINNNGENVKVKKPLVLQKT